METKEVQLIINKNFDVITATISRQSNDRWKGHWMYSDEVILECRSCGAYYIAKYGNFGYCPLHC